MMTFTSTQLKAMGEVAGELRHGIEVETTNLNGGSTIVMRGTKIGGTTKREILIAANGKTTELGTV